MNRTAARVASTCLAFAVGTTASLLWHQNKKSQSLPPPLTPSKTSTTEPAPTPSAIIAPTPDRDAVFRGGLKLVANEVQLKNEMLRYKVNVTYPQIEATKALSIRKLNRSIEQLATNNYQWVLEPTQQDLRYYKTSHPEAFNSVDLDYEVVLATDSFLSLYFEGFGYGIGAAHSVQYSFVVNYDLTSYRQVKLADVFKPGPKYLQFISEYCIEQLSRGEYGPHMSKDALAPVPKNFASWNMTDKGIRFNFDACKVFGCAGGKQTVEIPFAALRPLMSIR